jgi:hypothetical protein
MTLTVPFNVVVKQQIAKEPKTIIEHFAVEQQLSVLSSHIAAFILLTSPI